jgi:hypothetical protein
MAVIAPDPLPVMYINEADVLSELDDYGIRDITSTEPVIGLRGIIKEAALFISTHFDFKGVKCEPTQLLAFPRKEINDSYNYEIPECVKLAQMIYVVDILTPCESNWLSSFGVNKSMQRIGEYWKEQEFSTNPFMLKLNSVLEPLLNNDGLNEFLVGDEAL